MERVAPLQAAQWPLAVWLPVMLVAAAAAAAWAGCRLWRWRRQRQRQREQHRQDLESLLAEQQRQASSSVQQLADGAAPHRPAQDGGGAAPAADGGGGRSGSSRQRGSGGTQPAPPAVSGATSPPPGGHCGESRDRRARLAALLATHLGPRTRSLGRLPPEALPAALTHQLAAAEAAPGVQQKRRRKHRHRTPGAEGSGSRPARSSQDGSGQHQTPVQEELQLAMQHLQLPSGSQRRSPAGAGRRAPRTRPPPSTPTAAALGAGTPSGRPPPGTPAPAASGSGVDVGSPDSQGSSGSAQSDGSGGGSPFRGARGAMGVGGSGGSSLDRLASSGRGSVLEWLSSGEVCVDDEAQQQHGPPLAGLQFMAGGGSHGLTELGAGPHGVTYRGWLANRDVAIKVRAAKQAREPSSASAPSTARPCCTLPVVLCGMPCALCSQRCMFG